MSALGQKRTLRGLLYPLYLRKRTWISRAVMSAKCHKRTYCAAAETGATRSTRRRGKRCRGRLRPSTSAVAKLTARASREATQRAVRQYRGSRLTHAPSVLNVTIRWCSVIAETPSIGVLETSKQGGLQCCTASLPITHPRPCKPWPKTQTPIVVTRSRNW